MIERPTYQEVIKSVEAREQKILEWIKRNKSLLSQTDRVKITINIKGDSVIGEITSFPQ